LVLGDSASAYVAVPGPVTVAYEPTEGGVHPDDRIFSWLKSQEIHSGKVTLWDQCFELPGQTLENAQTVAGNVSAGTVSHPKVVGENTTLEVYEYPGGYAKRFDGTAPGGGDRASDVQNIFQDNARTAKIRLNQEQTPALVIRGAGNVRHL